MTIRKIKLYIFEIFDEAGIYIAENELEQDLDLRDYLVDSIQFVYFVVELEAKLDIELPDYILIYDNLSSINGFAYMVLNYWEELTKNT